MLVTLCASALKGRLRGFAPGGTLALTDVPRVARDELGLSGMVLSTDLLVGADRQSLTRILEAADKAGCPCLVLIEHTPQPLASMSEVKVNAATDRLQRVAQAAAWLGCSAFAIKIEAPDNDEAVADVAATLKPISRRSEKLELNLCIAPHEGLTSTPERVSELLKKIGGFRVGTLPDFGVAMSAADPASYMRRLAPYASAILVPSSSAPVEAPAKGRKKAAASATPKPKKKSASKKKKDKEAGEIDDIVDAVMAEVEGAGGPATMAGLVDVLVAVGFDGPLALDFRGMGDPMPALTATRDTIFKAIGRPDPGADLGEAELGLPGEDEQPSAREESGEEE